MQGDELYRGTLIQFTLHMNNSAVRLNDPGSDRETETGASAGAGPPFVHPIKPFENIRDLFAGNADSRIR